MKKVISGILVVSILVAAGYYFTQKTETNEVSLRTITVQEAQNELSKDTEIILIDVRTPAEYYGPSGHVKNALLRPIQNIQEWITEFEGLKNKKYMVICQSGGRSLRASQYLNQQGFRHITNVEGGMSAWNIAGLPVIHENSPAN